MISDKLPAVLTAQPGCKQSSISMERALRQIKEILEEAWMKLDNDERINQDRIGASIEDVEMMLKAILR